LDRFSDSPTYFVPPVADIENYRKFIEELPLHEDPAVFGLNENANITYQQQESNTLI
jgi:dynein heavy chain, axonemal